MLVLSAMSPLHTPQVTLEFVKSFACESFTSCNLRSASRTRSLGMSLPSCHSNVLPCSREICATHLFNSYFVRDESFIHCEHSEQKTEPSRTSFAIGSSSNIRFLSGRGRRFTAARLAIDSDALAEGAMDDASSSCAPASASPVLSFASVLSRGRLDTGLLCILSAQRAHSRVNHDLLSVAGFLVDFPRRQGIFRSRMEFEPFVTAAA
jgi:hypothetical protein